MQSKLQVGRLCTAATGRAAAGSCSGWLPSWAGPPPPGRLRAPVPIRKPGDGIGWMDGRNILGRARAAGRGRGRSTSSYSRSVGGRLRRRLGSAVSSRSSLERENGSPVVRADRDVAFWTGARELGLVLRVCGDPWRCHGVAVARSGRLIRGRRGLARLGPGAHGLCCVRRALRGLASAGRDVRCGGFVCGGLRRSIAQARGRPAAVARAKSVSGCCQCGGGEVRETLFHSPLSPSLPIAREVEMDGGGVGKAVLSQ